MFQASRKGAPRSEGISTNIHSVEILDSFRILFHMKHIDILSLHALLTNVLVSYIRQFWPCLSILINFLGVDADVSLKLVSAAAGACNTSGIAGSLIDTLVC